MRLYQHITVAAIALFTVVGLAQDPADRHAQGVGRLVEAINTGDHPPVKGDLIEQSIDTGVYERPE